MSNMQTIKPGTIAWEVHYVNKVVNPYYIVSTNYVYVDSVKSVKFNNFSEIARWIEPQVLGIRLMVCKDDSTIRFDSEYKRLDVDKLFPTMEEAIDELKYNALGEVDKLISLLLNKYSQF